MREVAAVATVMVMAMTFVGTAQLISKIQRMWKDANLQLKVRTYDILATSPSTGLMEMVLPLSLSLSRCLSLSLSLSQSLPLSWLL